MRLDNIASRWPKPATVLIEIDTDLSPCFDCKLYNKCIELDIACQEAYRHASNMAPQANGTRDPDKHWYNKLFPETDDD